VVGLGGDFETRDRQLAALRRSAEAARGNRRIWTEYVAALLKTGQKGRARKAVKESGLKGAERKALSDLAEGRRALPGLPLGDIARLIREGALDHAWELGHERMSVTPDDSRLLNLLGIVATEREEPLRAQMILERARALDPGSADIAANLGLVLVRQGETVRAAALLAPFAERPDAPAAVLVNLASARQRGDQPEEALILTERALALTPGDTDAVAIRTQAFLALGRGAEARAVLEPLAAAPGSTLQDLWADLLERTEGRESACAYVDSEPQMPRETAKRLVALLSEWGELARASRIARQLAESNPGDPAPFRLVGICQKWEAGDPLIEGMIKGSTAPHLTKARRATFSMSLAKAQMDLGDHVGAFEALLRGNRLWRDEIEYDVAWDEAEMAKIAEIWNSGAFERAGAGPGGPAPVFIVGLPRSGSTLAETILSRHPKVRALGETPFGFAIAERGRANPDKLIIASIRREAEAFYTPKRPTEVLTDKLLANFLQVGALSAAFPRARFIELRRDYRATCLSIFQAELLPKAHPYSLELTELARYAVAYDRLMTHWAGLLGSRLARVSYEALVSDPVSRVPELVTAAGLDWDAACLGESVPARRINTLSVAQARAPITTASIARWRPYEQGLAPLIEILDRAGLISGNGP